MERIQSAIQKAREARNINEEPEVKRASPSEVVLGKKGQTRTPSDHQIWADLSQIQLSTDHLHRERIVTDRVCDEGAPFDVLRTRLMHHLRENDWRRVAITSPGSACGKTTLCLNLAFSFDRQRDVKTMLIDFDMRRPSVDKILGQPGQRNFARALEGKDAPEKHLLCKDGKLAFATNTKPVRDSAELLQDKASAQIIDQLEARYDPNVMLFDTPPMLACDDTYAFLDQIDCVLLVAAAERTTAEELEKCQREIEARTNFLGVVLNKCRYLDKSDSYGY